MKKIMWLLLFFPFSLLAQKSHKVEPKESLYSIGRKFKVHPRELAEYNNISLSDGVKIGQVIKIPSQKKMEPLGDENPSESTKKEIKNEVEVNVTESNAVKKEKKESKTEVELIVTEKKSESKVSSTPIMHKVQKKETLYQISKKNNVSVEDIKKWNHLSADGVNEGSELIVGYEKGNSSSKDPEAVQTPTSTKATIKKETKKAEVTDDQSQVSSNESPTTEKGVVKETPKKEDQIPNTKKNTEGIKEFKGGYFASDYNRQINDKSSLSEQKGIVSSFKSTSGWDDGRYYCLYNNAPAGTIVKVMNPSNQKYIYAKVLDVIPDLKQNEGVSIIVSKAALEQLSGTTNKFDVELAY
jgi:LysM repeat protein